MQNAHTAGGIASRVALCVVGAFLGAMFATSVLLWRMERGDRVAGSAPLDQFDTGGVDDELEVSAWVPFGVLGALTGFVVALRLTRPIRPAPPRPPAIP